MGVSNIGPSCRHFIAMRRKTLAWACGVRFRTAPAALHKRKRYARKINSTPRGLPRDARPGLLDLLPLGLEHLLDHSDLRRFHLPRGLPEHADEVLDLLGQGGVADIALGAVGGHD